MARIIGSETNEFGISFTHYLMHGGTKVVQRTNKPAPSMQDLRRWKAARDNARLGLKLPRRAPSTRDA